MSSLGPRPHPTLTQHLVARESCLESPLTPGFSDSPWGGDVVSSSSRLPLGPVTNMFRRGFRPCKEEGDAWWMGRELGVSHSDP